MVEKFGKTSIQAVAPARCYAGPGDVACDVCTGRKRKAVKTCLECLNMVSIAGDPCTAVTKRTFSQSHFFEPLNKSVSAMKMQLKKKLDSIFKHELVKISAADSCHFTLDPNTAHRGLHLSEGNRRVEKRPEAPQSYPDHPDRFDGWDQVLCREGVSARCYWEVEWSGEVGIAVSYKSISRTGWRNECRFGYNDQSWSLHLGRTYSNFWHNYKKTELPLVASSRIGVYVDHRAGTLAFYSIRGDTMTLLHRVHTTFTHTLYPGFYVDSRSSVKLL
ncbi:stonustoxin subunit beta-like [Engraulis encrasicolus]|uniref:stonustoxin subunit beta-like n=1 Tax=Engraulis encrasicolus TaxID=184585 RepID=UPI002FCEB91B